MFNICHQGHDVQPPRELASRAGHTGRLISHEKQRQREKSMSNRKREPPSSDEEESEYSDVDFDSSGSEEVSPKQDIEMGTSDKRNKKRTPKKEEN